MSLNNPRGFLDEVNKATMADPHIAQNEVAARRRHRGLPGFGGWQDRVAVLVGAGVLVVFLGGIFWRMWG